MGGDAAQAAQQDAIADEVLTAGGLAVVVEPIAGELLGPRGVKGDVEEVRAIAVAAEHGRGDEAGAGVVALVAEDAVEFQRMPDGLVDLQDHLIGCEQDRQPARGAVRRQQHLQRFRRDAGRGIVEARLVEDLQPALTAVATSGESARLGVGAGVGGGTEHRHEVVKALVRAPAVGGHIESVTLYVPK